jgi:hypothetical protein
MLVETAVKRTDFQRRWTGDVAHAEATLMKDGVLAPLFVITGHDGRSLLIPADFSSANAKQHAITMARLAAIASDADLVLLRCESWIVVGPELAPGVTPATSDRRVEAVTVFAAGRIGSVIERRASLREIVRGPDGRPASLRDIAAPAGLEQFEGAMLDIQPPRRPTHEQQELAATLLAVRSSRVS